MLNARNLTALDALGSAALLLGAFIFEYFGYAPCKLCIWQRWPHGLAIGAGLIIAAFGFHRLLALLGALSAFVSASVGAYHVGVEQKWWEGPKGCSGFNIAELSPAEAMDVIMGAQLVRCDEVSWAFLGLSMPGWNMALSLVLVAVWLFSISMSKRT